MHPETIRPMLRKDMLLTRTQQVDTLGFNRISLASFSYKGSRTVPIHHMVFTAHAQNDLYPRLVHALTACDLRADNVS